jgi:hypothetical protein
VKYAVTNISLEELKALPTDVQVAYLAFGHINNDVGILLKLITRATVHSDDLDVVRVSRVLLSSFLMKLAAGRLNEGWETLNKNLNKLERDYSFVSKMAEEKQAKWESLKRYFSHDNPIRQIRKKLAFHSDTDDLLASLEILPQDAVLQDFHFEHSGNVMFGGAELAQLSNIAKIFEADDLVAGLDRLSDEIIEQAGKMTDVCFEFLLVFLREYFPDKLENVDLVELPLQPEHITTPLSFLYRFDE